VDATFFTNALDMVQRCTAWDTMTEDTITDTFHSGVRTRNTRNTNPVHVRKETLESCDIAIVPGPHEATGFPRTARVSIAREVPVDVPTTPVRPSHVRRQVRHSATHGGIRLDLSTVHSGCTPRELETSTATHVIEIEVVDARGRCPEHLATSLLLRILGFAIDDATIVDM
jgi:hypothetical protein